MNQRVKNLSKKLKDMNSLIINNLNELNIDRISSIIGDFERKIRATIQPPAVGEKIKKEPPIWKKFSAMTEEEIKQEFMNTEKYPTVDSIKEAVRGYLDLKKVSKVKKRETIIKHIIKRYGRGKFISRIGMRHED